MSYKQGDALPELVKAPVSRTQLVKYAGASGDFNPIHYDDEAARSGGLEGVIAHGMLSMGFLGQFVETAFGAGRYKRLEVRFQGMVKLGEVITCRGVVTGIAQENGREYAACEIEAVDSDGRVVTAGSAQAWLD
ncbi:MAG: MaoC/PaaZ C-terminal domain-containing protein [Nitrospinae bacterium]|nr:MaoC/PaaZ C-terminal domain-containing protein [Nitrospinota bacterium]